MTTNLKKVKKTKTKKSKKRASNSNVNQINIDINSGSSKSKGSSRSKKNKNAVSDGLTGSGKGGNIIKLKLKNITQKLIFGQIQMLHHWRKIQEQQKQVLHYVKRI
jgi:hypothetical protein